MPSRPQNDPPEITPDRRRREEPPSTSIMQGYEKMGPKGRRRIMWIGLAMLTAAVGVGLFGAALSLYRFIFVVFVTLIGTAFVFPQYGIVALEMIVPAAIAKMGPNWLQRPDRRDPE